jgi:hypothetical protein
MLIAELGKRFLDNELMNAFMAILLCIKICVQRGWKRTCSHADSGPLDARTLGFQTSLFKLTLKSHAKVAVEEPRDRNPVT